MIFSKSKARNHRYFFLLFAITLFFGGSTSAQILEPVKWSYTINKVNEEEALIVIKATIEPGWHLYSQDIPEDGPIPTHIELEENDDFELLSPFEEKGRAIEEFEEMFDMNVKYFEKRATFIGKIKLKKPSTRLKGTIEFMACDDTQCIMGEPIEIDERLSGYLGTEEQTDEKRSESTETEGGILSPVKWSYRIDQSSADKYSLVMRAEIDKGWHLYSQDNVKINGIGPEATAFSF